MAVKGKAFQFRVPKRVPRANVPNVKVKPLELVTLDKMVIKGQNAGSKEEYYVSKALDYLQLRYSYQVPVMGGRNVRGGQVLDFLVYTPVRETIVDVRGVYWHTGAREDNLDILRVARKFNYGLVIAWDYDVQDVAMATSFLRQHMPHG